MKTIFTSILICLSLTGLTVADTPLTGEQKVSLNLEKTPIVSVLNTIAVQYGLNLVLSGHVEGEVSLRLDEVDVATALDAILTANGYNYYLTENVIVVKPSEEHDPAELASKTLTLRYLDPRTAQKAVVSRLSPKGSAVVLDHSIDDGTHQNEEYHPNRILITDYASRIDDLIALVTEMDVPERTLLIEAKIVETTVDTRSQLGFMWPSAFKSRIDDARGLSGSSTTTTTTLEDDAAFKDLNHSSWTWGKLSVEEVDLVLDLLERDGNSRLVSNPRVTATENHESVIKVETIIPIQTINRFTEGAATSDIVTFEDEEVGLSLRVTPRINEGETITLEVYPVVEDIIGFNGPPDNQKPITSSRSIKTRVTMQSGETVALGGLLKESDIQSVQRVPLLGHIPVLGKLLFTNKKTEKQTTDLIIFITPRLINASEESSASID